MKPAALSPSGQGGYLLKGHEKMDIKSLLLKESDDLVADVEYKAGIRFRIKYISRGALTRLAHSCMIMKWDESKKTRDQTLDPEKFADQFCRRTVVGWSGVTPLTLSKIVALDLSKVPAEQQDEQIPFDIESMIAIVKEAYDLDTFLQDAAVDVKYFKPHHEEELGNSESSQSGS